MNFNGQHIVITGASSGIGLVTARLLVQRGAKLTLIARRSDRLLDGVGDGAKVHAEQRQRQDDPVVRHEPPEVAMPGLLHHGSQPRKAVRQ